MNNFYLYLAIFFTFLVVPAFVEIFLSLFRVKSNYVNVTSGIVIFLMLVLANELVLKRLTFVQGLIGCIPVVLGFILSIQISGFIKKKIEAKP